MQVYTIGCWLSWRIDDKLYSRTAYRRRSVKCETLPLTRTNMFRFLCQVVSEVGIITNGVGVIIIRCHLSTFGIRILFHQRQFIEIAEMFGDVWSRTRSMSIHESSWSLHTLALKAACLFIISLASHFLDLSPLQAARWMQLETWAFSLYRRSKWVLKFSRNLPKGQWYQKRGRVFLLLRHGRWAFLLLGCPEEDDFSGCPNLIQRVFSRMIVGPYSKAVPPPSRGFPALARMLSPLSQEFFRKVAGEGWFWRVCFKMLNLALEKGTLR